MAELVKINTQGLSEISRQLKSIEKDVQETESLIKRARNKLDWEVSSKYDIEESLDSICNSMSVQRKTISRLSNVTEIAIVKSDDFSSAITKMISGIMTSILGAIGSVLTPIGILSVFNSVTGMKDTLTHTVLNTSRSNGSGGNGAVGQGSGGGSRGESSESINTESGNNANSYWKGITGEELKNKISERDERILKNSDGTDNTASYNGWNARNDDGKVNCRWFTWKKVKEITGMDLNIKKLRELANSDESIPSGNGVRVCSLFKGGGKVRDVIDSITEPAENIVVSWGNSPKHQMLIDKIENGYVYFSDNSGASWSSFKETGVFPANMMSIEEYVSYYQTYNGDIDEIYQILV